MAGALQVPTTTAQPRRRRAALSRARILAAALQLVDEDGLEALTMRRLADQLQIDPMSIYTYVPSKEALLDGLAEALWSELQLPEADTGWKPTLRAFASSLRQLAHAHPHAFGLVLGRGILPAPALSAIDTALRSLEAAGLTSQQAAEMIRTLIAYAGGYALLELSCAPVARGTPLEQVVMLTRALPPDAPVRLVEVARLMADCDMDYQFDLGLDLILTGLEARL